MKSAIATDDADKIKAAKEDLEKTVQAVSTKLYQAAGAAQQANVDPGAAAGAAADDNNDGGNVYDADFKDVD